ncbi:MAG: hypothetical protein H6699_05120 [Myxococcales bacterium]|nr:hypothetical protein [Myxococcales bacterium]
MAGINRAWGIVAFALCVMTATDASAQTDAAIERYTAALESFQAVDESGSDAERADAALALAEAADQLLAVQSLPEDQRHGALVTALQARRAAAVYAFRDGRCVQARAQLAETAAHVGVTLVEGLAEELAQWRPQIEACALAQETAAAVAYTAATLPIETGLSADVLRSRLRRREATRWGLLSVAAGSAAAGAVVWALAVDAGHDANAMRAGDGVSGDLQSYNDSRDLAHRRATIAAALWGTAAVATVGGFVIRGNRGDLVEVSATVASPSIEVRW